MEKRNVSWVAIIGTVLFVAMAVCSVESGRSLDMIGVEGYLRVTPWTGSGHNPSNWNWLCKGAMFVFAVCFALRKRSKALPILVGIHVLFRGLICALDVIHLKKWGASTELLKIMRGERFPTVVSLFMIAMIILFFLTLCRVVPALRKNGKLVRILWFFPGLLIVIGYLIGSTTYILPYQLKTLQLMYIAHTLFSELREYTVFAFMEAAGLLLFGVWLKSDIEESWVIALLRKNPKICLKLDALENRKREKKVLPIDLLGGADKLRIYKELLDCGSITQEEFDEKKRQILGT